MLFYSYYKIFKYLSQYSITAIYLFYLTVKSMAVGVLLDIVSVAIRHCLFAGLTTAISLYRPGFTVCGTVQLNSKAPDNDPAFNAPRFLVPITAAILPLLSTNAAPTSLPGNCSKLTFLGVAVTVNNWFCCTSFFVLTCRSERLPCNFRFPCHG